MELSIIVFVLCMRAPRLICGEEYRISDTDDLIDFSNKVNSGVSFDGTTVLLENDLPFSEKQLENFEPIGTYEPNCFNGTFDGQGHTISNFVFNKSFRITGIFGISRGMTVKNIVVDESCHIETGYSSTSEDEYVNIGVIGCCVPFEHPCVIEGIVNMGDISYTGDVTNEKGTASIGGILGVISPYTQVSSIKNCANYGTIKYLGWCQFASFGGICGAYFNPETYTSKRCTLQNNFNGGKIVCKGKTGNMLVVGGIIGTSINSDVENCVNYGSAQFYVDVPKKGGIVGGYISHLEISHCYWMTTTILNEAAGFGYLSVATIKDSYPIDQNDNILDSLNSWASENGGTEWIALHTNMGTLRDANSSVVFAPKKTFPDPKRDGYSIIGWCTSSDCTNGIQSKEEIEEGIANITELYAQ